MSAATFRYDRQASAGHADPHLVDQAGILADRRGRGPGGDTPADGEGGGAWSAAAPIRGSLGSTGVTGAFGAVGASGDDAGGVRVAGGVRLTVVADPGLSRIGRLSERDGYKLRLMRRANPPEAIIINTGGGLASGDRVAQRFEVAAGAALTVTTQAAERCYRSADGATTLLDVSADLGGGAVFNWLPQETILFDDARLRRTIEVDLAVDARVLMAETVVFGRRAMGEQLAGGMFADQWRIRRGGRLIFAENVRLSGDAFKVMSAPVMAGGAHVAVTLLLAAPDAEDWLASARSVLAAAPFECGTSAWDEKLVVRALAQKIEDVHNLMATLVPALGGPPLPRTWSC